MGEVGTSKKPIQLPPRAAIQLRMLSRAACVEEPRSHARTLASGCAAGLRRPCGASSSSGSCPSALWGRVWAEDW